MNNFQFLNNFIDLQDQVSYDKVLNFDFARVAYSSTDTSTFANFCLVDRFLSKKEIEKMREVFVGLKRRLAFYFENRQDLNLFKEELEKEIKEILLPQYNELKKELYQKLGALRSLKGKKDYHLDNLYYSLANKQRKDQLDVRKKKIQKMIDEDKEAGR